MHSNAHPHSCLQPAAAWLQRMAVWIFASLSLCCAASPSTSAHALATAAAQRTVLDLDVRQQPVELGNWGDFHVATGAQLRPEDFAQTPVHWQPLPQDVQIPLQQGQTLWVKFTVPAAPDAERWYLELPLPTLDKATLYTADAAGRWQEVSAGDSVPVALWPVPSRHALLPIAVTAEDATRYMVAIQHNTTFNVPLQFISESHLSNREQRINLLLGVFFGLAILVAAYSALSAIVLRDANHAWYAAYVLAAGLGQASMTGTAAFVLWPQSPAWADVAPLVCNLLSIALLIGTVLNLSGAVHKSPKLTLASRAWMGALVLAVLGLFVLGAGDNYRAKALPFMALLSNAVLGLLLVQAFRLGQRRVALWLTAGVVPFVLLAHLPLAQHMGWINHGWATSHAMQLGLVWELPLVLLALALRAQERRAVLQRIQDFKRVDGSTGLIVQDVLVYRTDLSIRRARRFSHEACLYRVDIDNAEALRRQFGRKIVEEATIRLSNRFLRLLRDIDTVAHLDDGAFAMLIEGPIAQDEAQDLSTKLLARGLQPFEQLPSGLSFRMKIHMVMLPQGACGGKEALDQLARAAQRLDAGERRSIFVVDGPDLARPIDDNTALNRLQTPPKAPTTPAATVTPQPAAPMSACAQGVSPANVAHVMARIAAVSTARHSKLTAVCDLSTAVTAQEAVIAANPKPSHAAQAKSPPAASGWSDWAAPIDAQPSLT
jgi:two-component system, sensor histidine kinase LadS